MKEEEARKESLAEALVKTEKEKGSHSAGFEAWLRARSRREQDARRRGYD